MSGCGNCGTSCPMQNRKLIDEIKSTLDESDPDYDKKFKSKLEEFGVKTCEACLNLINKK